MLFDHIPTTYQEHSFGTIWKSNLEHLPFFPDRWFLTALPSSCQFHFVFGKKPGNQQTQRK
jgi:hypothetical protein